MQSKKEAPILQVLSTTKQETKHYQAVAAFIKKESRPGDKQVVKAYLTMEDKVIFNPTENGAFKALWESGQLALLIALPRCWQDLSLESLATLLDLDLEDDDFEEWSQLTIDERIDILYENSLSVNY